MKKLFFVILSLCMSSSIICMDIHEASTQGSLDRVQELLTSNPELVNARNRNKNTPLHCAAQNGHTEVASLLLDNKADVHAKNEHKGSPLHTAAFNGQTEVALLLLHYGADVNARNKDNDTPLRLAYGDSNRGVKQLLKDWPYYQRFRNLINHQINQLVALCMAQHSRLGENSPAHILPKDCYPCIAQFLKTNLIPENCHLRIAQFLKTNHTIEQIHKIAEQERQRNREKDEDFQQEYSALNQPRNTIGRPLLALGVVLAEAIFTTRIYVSIIKKINGSHNIDGLIIGSGSVLVAAICSITYRLLRR